MKTTKFLSMLAIAGTLFVSCSDDDDTPDEILEEEVITTMNVTLTPQGGGTDIILQTIDLDGDDGPIEPVVTVSGNLAGNTVYVGSIELLNETEDPVEDITEEIKELDEEHEFFFTTTGSIASVEKTDTDGAGNPLGLEFEFTTQTAGAATLTITLQHEPKKPNDGTVTDAGGETDINATFDLTIE